MPPVRIPRTARTNDHFFNLVLTDLFVNRNYGEVFPLRTATQSKNLIFDGLKIQSFAEIIFYKKPGEEIFVVHQKIARQFRVNLPHSRRLIEILNERGFPYELKVENLPDETNDQQIMRQILPFLTNLQPLPPPPPPEIPTTTLTLKQKKSWLVEKVKVSVVKEKGTCSIDLDDYEELVKTPCGHLFEASNLYNWISLYKNKTCPLCRSKLKN
jgi:hypothetical protein